MNTTNKKIAGLCKGSTADSDSVCEGSNPSPAAKRKPRNCKGSEVFFFFYPNRKEPASPMLPAVRTGSSAGQGRLQVFLRGGVGRVEKFDGKAVINCTSWMKIGKSRRDLPKIIAILGADAII